MTAMPVWFVPATAAAGIAALYFWKEANPGASLNPMAVAHGFGAENACHLKWIQKVLNRLGAHLSEDGRMGPSTRHAIKVFQHKHGLPADGVPGPHTCHALHVAIEKHRR